MSTQIRGSLRAALQGTSKRGGLSAAGKMAKRARREVKPAYLPGWEQLQHWAADPGRTITNWWEGVQSFQSICWARSWGCNGFIYVYMGCSGFIHTHIFFSLWNF